MGQVFKGVRVDDNTGQTTDVAVKFLYQDLPESAIKRSKNEAEIQIKNENLIEMMGFIEMEEVDRTGKTITRNFVISELLHGVMLYELLQGKTTDSQGVPVEYAEELYSLLQRDRIKFARLVVAKILAGVMGLHDRGYIHRDIDPSNIMITADGKIKLIDFGIAKNIAESYGNSSYAAPELITGDIAAHDYTTDLYQVGILLYELIVGERPFTGAEHEVMNKQISAPVPLENIPHKGLATIIEKAMRKEQRNRYKSAAQFRADLENWESIAISNTKSPDKPKNELVWWGVFSAIAVLAGVLLGLFL